MLPDSPWRVQVVPGYAPGMSVRLERLWERIRTIGERVVADHPEALKILAEQDSRSESTRL